MSIPAWLNRACQGLAFWVGYNHSKYPHHPLTEGAIAAEARNLIMANLSQPKYLMAEVYYTRLWRVKRSSRIDDQTRADLVVIKSKLPSFSGVSCIGKSVDAVIEIKRWGVSTKLIEEDLKRLSNALKHLPKETKGYLIIVAQSGRPSKYLNPKGTAHRRVLITDSGKRYRVRRICKAEGSFKGKSHHYVCVLEAFRS